MLINFNNKAPKKIYFNKKLVKKVFFNNKKVWEFPNVRLTPAVVEKMVSESDGYNTNPIYEIATGTVGDEINKEGPFFQYNKDTLSFDKITLASGTIIPPNTYKYRMGVNENTKVDGYLVNNEGGSPNIYQEKEIIIPNNYNGLPILKIADNAFADDPFLESVTINVPEIGRAVFANTKLKELYIGDNIQAIGSHICENTPFSADQNNYVNNILLPSSKNCFLSGKVVSVPNAIDVHITPNIKCIADLCLWDTAFKKIILDSPKLYVGANSFHTLYGETPMYDVTEIKLEITPVVKRLPTGILRASLEADPHTGPGSSVYTAYIKNIAPDFLINTNITELQKNCFTSLFRHLVFYKKTVLIPKQIQKIDPYCFEGSPEQPDNYMVETNTLSTGMFANPLSMEPKTVRFSQDVTIIPPACFSSLARDSDIVIPNSVHTIGSHAFEKFESSGSTPLITLTFEQPRDMKVILPTAGADAGAFYCKDAAYITIKTDNLDIKNYDYTTDNVTPTFIHLDGTPW